MADTRPSLIDLPDELLEMVFSDVEKKDLKNLRLTYRHLDDVSAALLFQQVVLLPMRGCIEGFDSVLSASPHLAACVKTISYNEVWHNYLHTQPESEKMSCMKKELLAGVQDQYAEIALLRSVSQRLPYLRAVHVYEAIGGYSRIDEVRYPPKYLQRHIDSLATDDLVDPYSGERPRHRSIIAMPIFTALALEGSRLTTFLGLGSMQDA